MRIKYYAKSHLLKSNNNNNNNNNNTLSWYSFIAMCSTALHQAQKLTKIIIWSYCPALLQTKATFQQLWFWLWLHSLTQPLHILCRSSQLKDAVTFIIFGQGAKNQHVLWIETQDFIFNSLSSCYRSNFSPCHSDLWDLTTLIPTKIQFVQQKHSTTAMDIQYMS